MHLGGTADIVLPLLFPAEKTSLTALLARQLLPFAILVALHDIHFGGAFAVQLTRVRWQPVVDVRCGDRSVAESHTQLMQICHDVPCRVKPPMVVR